MSLGDKFEVDEGFTGMSNVVKIIIACWRCSLVLQTGDLYKIKLNPPTETVNVTCMVLKLYISG